MAVRRFVRSLFSFTVTSLFAAWASAAFAPAPGIELRGAEVTCSETLGEIRLHGNFGELGPLDEFVVWIELPVGSTELEVDLTQSSATTLVVPISSCEPPGTYRIRVEFTGNRRASWGRVQFDNVLDVALGAAGPEGAPGERGPVGPQGSVGPEGPPGNLALAGLVCAPGTFVAGFDQNGRPICGLPPACGNGVLEAPETCDDGNVTPGDGCNEVCGNEDQDGDGVADPFDNCVSIANPDQTDSDGDGRGDACEGSVKLDVILVVDSSGSMENEINAISAGFNAFAAALKSNDLDAHVVLIADQSQLCVPPPQGDGNCSAADPNLRLIDARVGSREALEQVLARYDDYKDFLRENASKHILVISDDDSDLSATEFTSTLSALTDPGFPDGFVLHAIVVPGWSFPGIPLCGGGVGSVYLELASSTGGFTSSICDFSEQVLIQVAQEILDISGGCVFEGAFTSSPPMVYTCALGLVNLNVTGWVFAESGPTLSVTGTGLPFPLTGPGPSCSAPSFVVEATVGGTCTEHYILAGTFDASGNWSGTFDANFVGANCADCTAQRFSVSGIK